MHYTDEGCERVEAVGKNTEQNTELFCKTGKRMMFQTVVQIFSNDVPRKKASNNWRL